MTMARPHSHCSKAAPAAAPQVLGTSARVLGIDGERALLDDGRCVARATSCLVQPEPGDRVLVCEAPALILAVLERPDGREARLSVAGVDTLRLQQRNLAVEAIDTLALRAAREAELSTAGSLRIAARDLATTVLQTLIERAGDRIAKFASYALQVGGLLHMHSGHGIITAERQLRMDAEQLHLG
jgi:hypothetical protein